MANNNDMITLNIYNQPPPKSVDETGMNINQTEQDLNLNTDKPQMNPVFYDNVRNDQQNNYNSAPRGNINNKSQNITNTADESSDSSEVNPNNDQARPPPVQNVQYQQPIQPVYQQIYYKPNQAGTPAAVPIIVPYNMQYGNPVVIQGNQVNNRNAGINNAPKTIIIREKEKPRKSKGEDCCAGFLAGCAACLTITCLMGLCCPHGHRGHRGRW